MRGIAEASARVNREVTSTQQLQLLHVAWFGLEMIAHRPKIVLVPVASDVLKRFLGFLSEGPFGMTFQIALIALAPRLKI